MIPTVKRPPTPNRRPSRFTPTYNRRPPSRIIGPSIPKSPHPGPQPPSMADSVDHRPARSKTAPHPSDPNLDLRSPGFGNPVSPTRIFGKPDSESPNLLLLKNTSEFGKPASPTGFSERQIRKARTISSSKASPNSESPHHQPGFSENRIRKTRVYHVLRSKDRFGKALYQTRVNRDFPRYFTCRKTIPIPQKEDGSGRS